jgi:hypothetical protein
MNYSDPLHRSTRESLYHIFVTIQKVPEKKKAMTDLFDRLIADNSKEDILALLHSDFKMEVTFLENIVGSGYFKETNEALHKLGLNNEDVWRLLTHTRDHSSSDASATDKAPFNRCFTKLNLPDFIPFFREVKIPMIEKIRLFFRDDYLAGKSPIVYFEGIEEVVSLIEKLKLSPEESLLFMSKFLSKSSREMLKQKATKKERKVITHFALLSKDMISGKPEIIEFEGGELAATEMMERVSQKLETAAPHAAKLARLIISLTQFALRRNRILRSAAGTPSKVTPQRRKVL